MCRKMDNELTVWGQHWGSYKSLYQRIEEISWQKKKRKNSYKNWSLKNSEWGQGQTVFQAYLETQLLVEGCDGWENAENVCQRKTMNMYGDKQYQRMDWYKPV